MLHPMHLAAGWAVKRAIGSFALLWGKGGAAWVRGVEHMCPPALAQDKILQSMGRGQEVMVTNDGATILKSLYVDNPAAKVLVGGFPWCWCTSSPMQHGLCTLFGATGRHRTRALMLFACTNASRMPE